MTCSLQCVFTTCVPQENGRRQKSQVCEKFDHLYAIMEERKREMSLKVTAEQEEKLNYIQGLKRKYSDHLETTSKIVETGIQTMEEPEMAVFLQVSPGFNLFLFMLGEWDLTLIGGFITKPLMFRN